MSVPAQGEIWWAEVEDMTKVGHLGSRRLEVCEALRALADC